MLAPLTAQARDDVTSHTWQLRDVEYEDAVTISRFECLACGAVRYE